MINKNTDERWMRLALSLGARGAGQTWPNPFVGCVIVKNSLVIGRGYTQQGGRPHAETVALQQASNDAENSTVYVTLEPCAHTGKTHPCVNNLIKAGIKRVVIAAIDPDHRVSGKGIQILKNAGIEVSVGILKEEAEKAHAGFFSILNKKRPFLSLKIATSIDGRIATQTGNSKWLTGAESRQFVHYLRATHDAVLVGRGTVEADNPSLNVRGFGRAVNQPVRIVMDSNLKIDTKSNLITSAKEIPLWICHAKESEFSKLSKTGAMSIACKHKNGGIDLQDAMENLAKNGLTRILCEGGGKLAASLLNENLVDELIVMQAGLVIGKEGTAAISGLGIDALVDAPNFDMLETRRIGNDVLSIWSRATYLARVSISRLI
ncbi:bifunctional diaminohydroxyphosphoribosylaminopyrimidine deaminase/5-amino-6-(5-phosphoribosylamino)uracil reductase RibD [Amylibacter sp.]|nr:bifunctional diaminohydroxyphosphoribosylaminopyrimidine deaminase/5-amino-6-(5-phosphoribosylamino)uracil reductase RibD [Amylibacter sp.]